MLCRTGYFEQSFWTSHPLQTMTTMLNQYYTASYLKHKNKRQCNIHKKYNHVVHRYMYQLHVPFFFNSLISRFDCAPCHAPFLQYSAQNTPFIFNNPRDSKKLQQKKLIQCSQEKILHNQ